MIDAYITGQLFKNNALDAVVPFSYSYDIRN